MPPLDPKQRFSSRVADYVKYRPGYPRQILALLRSAMRFSQSWPVADLGSGTGISSEMFVGNGNQVFAVEPNPHMRAAAEQHFTDAANFHSIDGAAEATTLPDGSVQLVVAGQAFHWFDHSKTRIECMRILREGGYALLMWNERKRTGTPFLEAYERLLISYGTDYWKVRHENTGEDVIARFFGGRGFETATFPNRQSFDVDGLIGRLLSSSYIPQRGDAKFDEMVQAARELFAQHQREGQVTMEYECELYWGHVL
jgi:SAM-dependent methyltransferase